MLVGQQLGPFLIDKELGAGAMGAVYRDAKPEMLSPATALLVILGWIAIVGFFAQRRLRRADVLS